jgi:Ser-tRNA(Ala) deacylase AlaX
LEEGTTVSNDADLSVRPDGPGRYEDTFAARVVEVSDDTVVLDPGLMLPDGDGRAGDRGTVDGATILYVHRDPGGSRVGLPHTAGFTTGRVVEVVVNFRRRFALMRIATALALLQVLLGRRWPACQIADVEFEPGIAWVIVEGRLDLPIEDVEATLNAHVTSMRPVTMTTRPDGVGLVGIPGLPVLPTHEQHVAKTREVGRVKLSDATGAGERQQCLVVRLLAPEELI